MKRERLEFDRGKGRNMPKICVVSSCGKKKLVQHDNQPSCAELDSVDQRDHWRHKLSKELRNAESMYTGYQNREIYRGVSELRKIGDVEVDYFIISAGFGVLHEGEQIPPYDCSFNKMTVKQIESRARKLDIPRSFSEIQQSDYNLMYLALGSKYLRALGNDWPSNLTKTTICFHKKYESKYIVNLPANTKIVKAYSAAGHKIHGVVGFKGDLLRVLVDHALKREKPSVEVGAWANVDYFYDTFYSLGNMTRPMKEFLGS